MVYINLYTSKGDGNNILSLFFSSIEKEGYKPNHLERGRNHRAIACKVG